MDRLETGSMASYLRGKLVQRCSLSRSCPSVDLPWNEGGPDRQGQENDPPGAVLSRTRPDRFEKGGVSTRTGHSSSCARCFWDLYQIYSFGHGYCCGWRCYRRLL